MNLCKEMADALVYIVYTLCTMGNEHVSVRNKGIFASVCVCVCVYVQVNVVNIVLLRFLALALALSP